MTALTTREHDVMRLVCEGLTGQAIGEVLGISSRTVEIHRRSAILKLGARNQTHAAVLFDRAHAVLNNLAPATPKPEPVLRWEGEWLRLGAETVGCVGSVDELWRWRCGITGESDWARDAAHARTAAEQAVRDWLKRAGCV